MDDSLPPGKGNGEDADKDFKGKGSERAEVLDMLDSIDLKTGRSGRPRKRPKQLNTCDKMPQISYV